MNGSNMLDNDGIKRGERVAGEPRGRLRAGSKATLGEVEGSDDREFITSLSRGLSVLQAFDRDHPEMTLSEVARATSLSPGTARRCLFTLACLGYVGSQGRRFYLLPKVISLGAAYLDAARIDEAIYPYLRELVDTIGDSSSLAVLDGGSIMHVANYSAKRLIRMTIGTGTRFPAYATSMGRVLLAELPPEQLDEALDAVERVPFTRNTVTDPVRLKAILKKVQRDGYAHVVDELEEGLSSTAVPVRVHGEVVASLNSSMFFRADESARAIERRVASLRQAADAIAEAIQRLPALKQSLLASRGTY